METYDNGAEWASQGKVLRDCHTWCGKSSLLGEFLSKISAETDQLSVAAYPRFLSNSRMKLISASTASIVTAL